MTIDERIKALEESRDLLFKILHGDSFPDLAGKLQLARVYDYLSYQLDICQQIRHYRIYT